MGKYGRWALALILALFSFPGFAQQPPTGNRDAYHAHKSIEVGKFYLKKGKIDAAIDRFHEALRYEPNLAEAYELLGEACEKKDDKAEAIKNYRQYLKILPRAEDARNIERRIRKLMQELEKENRRASRSG